MEKKKNYAPEWMEGTYTLTVRKNEVTLVSPDEHVITAKCHPQDKFVLTDGVTKVFTDLYIAHARKLERKFKKGDKVLIDDATKIVNACPFDDKDLLMRYDYGHTLALSLDALFGIYIFEGAIGNIAYISNVNTKRGYCIDINAIVPYKKPTLKSTCSVNLKWREV